MNKLRITLFLLLLGLLSFSAIRGEWKPSHIRQLNGREAQITLAANFQIVSESWNEVIAAPTLVYMPERDELLMLVACCGYPSEAALTISRDHGATWSAPRFVHTDSTGKPDTGLCSSLTYLGKGKALLLGGKRVWFSSDYGRTWSDRGQFSPSAKGEPFYIWDPLFVDKDPRTGRIIRLLATGYQPTPVKDRGEPVYQGVIRWSTDEGRAWSEPQKVPQWFGFNETVLLRAKNGDLVAACRSDGPQRFMRLSFDHYSGLGISISKDNGRTWSKMNMLYDWGRHHPSMVLLPNGDIVLSYVVRRGYPDAPDGFAQFGVEAVVSHDNGQSWDLDHRYILKTWKSDLKGSAYWYASSQSTSTLLLPDGSLLTAFGTGYRAKVDPKHFGHPAPRDVGLIEWHLGNNPLNNDRTIANAPFDSDLRNKFDPNPGGNRRGERIGYGGNLAVKEAGARVKASRTDEDPNYLLYDGYTHPVVTLESMPAWVEVTWPKAHWISQIRLYPGAPAQSRLLRTECVPLDYRLQYKKGDEWVDVVPPTTNAIRFKTWAKTAKDDGAVDSYVSFQYVHKFAPIKTDAVRINITRSSDPGKRDGYGEKVVVPENKRETVLRRIDVIEGNL